MLIDRTHRTWAIGSAAFLLLASLLYVIYASTWPNGPSGRSWPGMVFGIVGTIMMLFAGALSIRKKTVRLRLGSLSWWLRAHIWIGLLSVPIILFHAAFRWGGWLELSLWLMLAIVIVSGIVGLAMQNILPRAMKIQLPNETIPDQFAERCRRLILAADEMIMTQCTPAVLKECFSRASEANASSSDTPLVVLANFHINTVRPYLADTLASNQQLANSEHAQLLFDQVRATLPDNCHATVDSLEKICSERRQLARQERLFRLLHAWLKVHVPCSIILFVLTAIHVFASLYY